MEESTEATILHVNDYEPSRYTTSKLLGQAGFSVFEAGSGAEALQTIEATPVDLVLLDVGLPDFDGFEVCRRIRELPHGKTVPVLLTSAAYVERDDRVRGLEGGADAYLVEPVEAAELLATIRALLRMRAAEAGLRTATEQWRTTFNAISEAIAVVDADGRIARSNSAFQTMTRSADTEGASIDELLPRVESEGRELKWRLLLDGRQKQLEVLWQECWLDLRIDPIEGEEARCSVLVFSDMTERKKIEQERAEFLQFEQQARSAAEASKKRSEFLSQASLVLVSSLAGVEQVRRIAEITVSCGVAEWCLIDLLDSDGQLESVAVAGPTESQELTLRTAHTEALSGEGSHPVQTVLARGTAILLDAEQQPQELHGLGLQSLLVAPLMARGRPLGVVTLGRGEGSYSGPDLDLVDNLCYRLALALDNARLYDEAQKVNRAKDEFLGTLSHELRTPLTATLGWARMLREGGLDESSAVLAIETIEKSARLQAQIIDDILDVSKMVTGQLTLEAQLVDFGQIVRDEIESARNDTEGKNLTIDANLTRSSVLVLGDPLRLKQIVRNLLVNAVKFNCDGGSIRVELEQEEDGCLLRVSDTGRGIPVDFIPFVFDRFRQAESSTAREFGGLGLGLAIVRYLTDLHAGSVSVESAGEEQGATFTVRLPRPPEGDTVSADSGGGRHLRQVLPGLGS
jgi:PAS domain S-box-containing protein